LKEIPDNIHGLTGTALRGGHGVWMFSLMQASFHLVRKPRSHPGVYFSWHLACYGWRVEFNLTTPNPPLPPVAEVGLKIKNDKIASSALFNFAF
jgi:hypothetical protein